MQKGVKIRKDQEIFSVGALVRLLRVALCMTQRQLAQRAGMPHSTIARIEKEGFHPSTETLRKIFDALECDIAYIPIPRFSNLKTLFLSKAKKTMLSTVTQQACCITSISKI